jgi:hypothetical protein
MFEMLMLLGFFVIGFSHLLPSSEPKPQRERPPVKGTQTVTGRRPRGQRPTARERAKAASPFRRDECSASGALGKIRRLC